MFSGFGLKPPASDFQPYSYSSLKTSLSIHHRWQNISFWIQWAAFLGAWCPLPAIRSCFVEFAQHPNVLSMNLCGRKWSPVLFLCHLRTFPLFLISYWWKGYLIYGVRCQMKMMLIYFFPKHFKSLQQNIKSVLAFQITQFPRQIHGSHVHDASPIFIFQNIWKNLLKIYIHTHTHHGGNNEKLDPQRHQQIS